MMAKSPTSLSDKSEAQQESDFHPEKKIKNSIPTTSPRKPSNPFNATDTSKTNINKVTKPKKCYRGADINPAHILPRGRNGGRPNRRINPVVKYGFNDDDGSGGGGGVEIVIVEDNKKSKNNDKKSKKSVKKGKVEEKKSESESDSEPEQHFSCGPGMIGGEPWEKKSQPEHLICFVGGPPDREAVDKKKKQTIKKRVAGAGAGPEGVVKKTATKTKRTGKGKDTGESGAMVKAKKAATSTKKATGKKGKVVKVKEGEKGVEDNSHTNNRREQRRMNRERSPCRKCGKQWYACTCDIPISGPPTRMGGCGTNYIAELMRARKEDEDSESSGSDELSRKNGIDICF